jgi:hypothetical protein
LSRELAADRDQALTPTRRPLNSRKKAKSGTEKETFALRRVVCNRRVIYLARVGDQIGTNDTDLKHETHKISKDRTIFGNAAQSDLERS